MASAQTELKKPADTNLSLIDEIRDRWSPRAFDSRPVEPLKLCSVLEAARWAPSCFGEEPWRFIVGDKTASPETHAMLADLLVPANRSWAEKAPVLIFSVAKLKFTYNNEPNRHAQHDVGLAVENLVLQAQALGLHTHQMGGIEHERALDVFGIPRGEFEVMAGIALGYMGSVDDLPKGLKERELEPRTRKPLQDLVFARHWLGAFPICVS